MPMPKTYGLESIDPKTLYGLSQVARALSVSWDTADKLVREGKLPHRIIGSRKKVLGMDLLGYVGLQGPLPPGMTAEEAEREKEETLKLIRSLVRTKQRKKS